MYLLIIITNPYTQGSLECILRHSLMYLSLPDMVYEFFFHSKKFNKKLFVVFVTRLSLFKKDKSQ